MSILFAATYPERTSALILYGSYARRLWAPDYPWGPTVEQRQEFLDTIEHAWGTRAFAALYAPPALHDDRLADEITGLMRRAASPGAALALARMNAQIDVRHVLPSVAVPTLVLFRTGDPQAPPGYARYLAEHIPGAKLIELAGDHHLMHLGDSDAIIDEIEELVTGERHAVEPDRVLATVMFTDIVGSTEHLTAMGDRRWRDLLAEHYRLARREVSRFRGHEVKATGDGLLASFDGPARAVRCAVAIRDAVRSLGIEIRAGVHTGEVEVMADDLGGIAVHVGARVMAQAGPGEVLASSTVKDLVAGSGLDFEDQGAHTLRGVSGEWRLFSVRP